MPRGALRGETYTPTRARSEAPQHEWGLGVWHAVRWVTHSKGVAAFQLEVQAVTHGGFAFRCELGLPANKHGNAAPPSRKGAEPLAASNRLPDLELLIQPDAVHGHPAHDDQSNSRVASVIANDDDSAAIAPQNIDAGWSPKNVGFNGNRVPILVQQAACPQSACDWRMKNMIVCRAQVMDRAGERTVEVNVGNATSVD